MQIETADEFQAMKKKFSTSKRLKNSFEVLFNIWGKSFSYVRLKTEFSQSLALISWEVPYLSNVMKKASFW